MFTSFVTIHERDRRTDTARRHRPRLCRHREATTVIAIILMNGSRITLTDFLARIGRKVTPQGEVCSAWHDFLSRVSVAVPTRHTDSNSVRPFVRPACDALIIETYHQIFKRLTLL